MLIGICSFVRLLFAACLLDRCLFWCRGIHYSYLCCVRSFFYVHCSFCASCLFACFVFIKLICVCVCVFQSLLLIIHFFCRFSPQLPHSILRYLFEYEQHNTAGVDDSLMLYLFLAARCCRYRCSSTYFFFSFSSAICYLFVFLFFFAFLALHFIYLKYVFIYLLWFIFIVPINPFLFLFFFVVVDLFIHMR